MTEREREQAVAVATAIYCVLLTVRPGIGPGGLASEAWEHAMAFIGASREAFQFPEEEDLENAK